MKTSPPSFKSTGGLRRIANAFGYSMQGLKAAFQHEAAFRQELLLCLIALPTAYVLSANWQQFILLCACLLIILVVELLNAAIETLADALHPDYHPLVGRAKDIGSAAVLLSFIIVFCLWAVILIPNFWP